MVENPQSLKAPNFCYIFNDGFIPQLFQSFISSLDPERAWRDSANRLDNNTRDNYFRLNVPFIADEPRLDDVDCIEEMR